MHSAVEKLESKDSARRFGTQGARKYSVTLLRDDIISAMHFGYKSEITY